jgi:trimeric autotransporter adhesin
MKAKYSILVAALIAPTIHAANIDVIGDSLYSENSFVSANSGVDGGLGTNIRVIKGTNVTWTKDNNYFIKDRLFIPRGATLTIQPGTKVYGSFDDNNTAADRTDDKIGAIVACRGGKLIADGTAAEPIVFTSVREWEAANNLDSPYDQGTTIGPAPTAADGGQWGGIILLGQAFCASVDLNGVNAGTVQIEGFAPTGTPSYDGDSIPDATQYGVSTNFPRNDADNSGTIRYVSIRHGGYEFSTGKEINGLTLGAVGFGTTIEYVEVFANQDDGIEFFGGRVNTKYMVMAFNQDDSFDIDEGYRGINQFWLCIQNPGDTDGGGEWDGVGGTSAGYSTVGTIGSEHHSRPTIYNATFIGAGADNTLTLIPTRGTAGTKAVNFEKGNFGMIIEDYFNGEIYNSCFHDFSAGLMRFIDAASIGAQARFVNNTIGSIGVNTSTTVVAATNTTAYGTTSNTTGASDARAKGFAPFSLAGVAQNGNTDVNTNPMFTTYTRSSTSGSLNVLTGLNPVPASGSPLLSGAITGGAPVIANYRGAFGTVNWAAGWTKLSQVGFLQGAGAPPAIVDTDGDGISDALEATTALTDLGFSSSVNNVTPTNRFSSLYTSSSIQTLRGTSMMIGPVTAGGSTTLTLPLFKSSDLVNWTPFGNVTATVTTPAGKNFYRVDISSNAPNP